MGSTFSKKDLKTGMKVTVSNPIHVGYDEYIVLLGTPTGDFLINTEVNSFNPLSGLSLYGEIVKVQQSNVPFNLVDVPIRWETIWERQPEPTPTPEQIKAKKLQETIDKLSSELDNAKKNLSKLNN